MQTLELFNVVLAKPGNDLYVSEDGYIIDRDAVWAKNKIIKFYRAQKLSGVELNESFHKSFSKVQNSSRFELFIEQIRHYLSTYGSDFQDEVYIPDEVLEIPDLKLTYKVIRGVSANELTEKCLNMLRSGVALTEDTIAKILNVLVSELKYIFTGNEGIRNKEAIIKIADMYGIVPADTMDFFRYVIYRSTGESLLMKNDKTIQAIKSSEFNPAEQFRIHGLNKLATIFNRFKPLFLAFKNKCPIEINRISKLSKTLHIPMVQNPLNKVTQTRFLKTDKHWLDNATPFAFFKSLSALHNRISGQTTFCYRIRNGKSFCKKNDTNVKVCEANYKCLIGYAKKRWNMNGKKIYIPQNVEYALPTSEKMFVGNIPTGTKFSGEKLAVGVYWRNDWGANDIDLSANSINSRIGWNSRYYGGALTYSGDITSAPNGAVEYIHCDKGLNEPWLINSNIYRGNDTAGYKIVIGLGDNVNKKYMMDPNKVLAEIKTESVQKQTVLGFMLPGKLQQSFVLLNFGSGNVHVAKSNGKSVTALYEQYNNPLSFNKLIVELGGELVDTPEKADIDLSLNSLTKDSFTSLFV